MAEVCPVCGLPKDLCVCEDIAREQQQIEVSSAKRTFGKIITIIKGIDEKHVDLDNLASELKANLACGGTVKDGKIELQGDHRSRVKEILTGMGFSDETIVLK